MQYIKIGKRVIGKDKEPIVVSEIGINHNGDLSIAKELIKSAKDSGCDAVKFQKRTIEDVYTPEELDVPRKSPFGTTNREQKNGLEFGEKEYDQIDKFCKDIKFRFPIQNINWI